MLSSEGFLQASSEAEIRRIAEGDPGFVKAKEILDELSEDAKIRQMAQAREHARVNRLIIEGASFREGMEKGLAEGEARGEARGRRDMIRMFCRLRGITLSADQEAWLESATLPKLEAKLQELERDGVWQR